MTEPLLNKLKAQVILAVQSHTSTACTSTLITYLSPTPLLPAYFRVPVNSALSPTCAVILPLCSTFCQPIYREGALLVQEFPSRVVALSSLAHTFQKGPIDFNDLHYKDRAYTRYGAYGQSKAANVLFAKEFAARCTSTRYRVMCMWISVSMICYS